MMYIVLFFETGSHIANTDLKTCNVAEDDTKLMILLLPPKCWDYRYEGP